VQKRPSRQQHPASSSRYGRSCSAGKKPPAALSGIVAHRRAIVQPRRYRLRQGISEARCHHCPDDGSRLMLTKTVGPLAAAQAS
jgi:hypothetical protein